ncbi:MAG: xanthine dehydrogenase family protein molybdopterin-binding subunit [Chloroflexota bacterium]|nr:xanthine dehydrogenase family protein molybdopterin-binding subunit [Chloroflexota bacterium]
MVRVVRTKVEMEGRTHEEIVVVEGEEPKAWATSELHHVGQALSRVDGVERVTGAARFTADVQLPGMLYAAVARCPHPHARLRSLDTRAAEALPGVRAVLTHENAPLLLWHSKASRLFDTELRHEGDEIAAVAADDPETAERAVRLIRAEYEVLPYVIDPAEAMRPGAVQVHPAGNVLKDDDGNEGETYTRGDVAQGFKQADVIFEGRFTTAAQMHNALETHGTVAAWDGPNLTIYESTQGVYSVRSRIAQVLDLPQSQVRVIKNYVGGAFGAKLGANKHALIATLLARNTGRPVHLMLDRRAENLVAGFRAPTVQQIKIGAKRDGTLTAVEMRILSPIGAYGMWVSSMGGPAKELYTIPNMHIQTFGVRVHTGSHAAFRAPGYVEGAVALEGALDEIAAQLGMDPIAIRMKNYAAKDPGSDQEFTAKHLDQCYRRGAEMFGWDDLRKELAAARKQTPVDATAPLRGIGMASQNWGGGGGPTAQALCRINSDGSVDVHCGTQDLGTGTRTVLAQIAADALNMGMEQMRVLLGDTDKPYAPVSGGSMTVASVGPAVRMAADEARKQLLEIASAFMDTSPDRLEIRAGQIVRKGKTDGGMSIKEVMSEISDYQIVGKGFRGPNPPEIIRTWGAQFAEVLVDPVTGGVQVVRMTGVYDTGRVINPLTYTSQIHGGIIQGLGFALTEARTLDPTSGKSLNPNLEEYKVPTVADLPQIDVAWIGEPDFLANHLGAKGIGEPPIIPTPAAIANAVADALGVRVFDLPITPERVLTALAGGMP